jgi:chemotaxis protein methyltransferase CheR
MIDPALERLKQAVIEKTGHHYYADKDKLLFQRARERMHARGMATLEAYLDLLATVGDPEWRALEDAIMIGETYFFRYPDHFAALRETILPDLIARRRETRTLRIWSIGCANGSEPYSVAILLRELLGAECDDWRISLIGGDISERALAAARAGRYGAWALRTLGPAERERYFDRDGSVWTLKSIYRSMARFERQNILDLMSPTPPLEWNGFDLILCRNVLIYFSPEHAITIMRALRACLVADGSLLLGHAEATLSADPVLAFAPTQSTEFGQALRLPVAPPYVPPVLPPAAELPAASALSPGKTESIAPEITEADALVKVQTLADAGAYEEAENLCRALIARNPTSARLQFYDAVLRQVSDDLSGAEAALRRAIYLDRNFAVAHHRLGVLMLGLGRMSEARRALLAAARLAETVRSEVLLMDGHGVSAGEFRDVVRRQLATLADPA